jgi:hypothetical protein
MNQPVFLLLSGVPDVEMCVIPTAGEESRLAVEDRKVGCDERSESQRTRD